MPPPVTDWSPTPPEIGLDDGVTALRQLGLITGA
jgi:hypothetical protein